MSFYSVGVGALNAAQLGLTTAGHNIANVNTDGFHRQSVSQSTNVPIMTGSGFIGQGANVDTIRRVYSQFLDGQVLQAQTKASSLDAYQTQISQIDNILADPSAGLSPALQDFFAAVGEVSTNPQSVPSRQALISAGSAMVSRFQTLDLRFTEIQNGLNSQITSSVTTINSLAQQIANVNNQILTQTSSTSQPPNDLLDTRDNLVSQLNQMVQATVVKQDDGSFNVFIGNGQPLVIGTQTFNLTASPSPEDQGRIEVGYQAGTTNIILPKNSLTGGTLGGLLDFRTTTLDAAQNALGQIAVTIAKTFNDQQALGQDLKGVLGQNFFASPTPTVIASTSNTGAGALSGVISNTNTLTLSDYRIQVTGTGPNAYSVTDVTNNTTVSGLTDATLTSAIPGVTLTLGGGWAPAVGDVFSVKPTRDGAGNIALSSTISATTIAAASPVVVNASTSNTGNATIVDSGITSVPLPTLPITLTYNSGTNQFSYGAGPTLVTYTPGTAMTIAGNVSVTLNGTPGNGDIFTIGANTNGVADNRNALLMGKLQTANTMAGGTTSYQGAYSQMVSQVGNKAAEVKVTSQAQQNLLTQSKNAQQGLSGVNLDEEAASLLKYQQAYQAAGKMMQIASNMFSTLLSIMQ
jgi:flagellar hook-associated protein 1 FlgK